MFSSHNLRVSVWARSASQRHNTVLAKHASQTKPAISKMGIFLAEQKQWPRKFNAASIFYCFIFSLLKMPYSSIQKSKGVQVTMCETKVSSPNRRAEPDNISNQITLRIVLISVLPEEIQGSGPALWYNLILRYGLRLFAPISLNVMMTEQLKVGCCL